MSKVATKSQLDAAGCDVPYCGHDHSILYMHKLCHPHEHNEVFYEKATGNLVVCCKRCKAELIRVGVAD